MSHIAPLGITCVTIDAFFYALIETEWALSRRLEAGPEEGPKGDSRGESARRCGRAWEQDLKD